MSLELWDTNITYSSTTQLYNCTAHFMVYDQSSNNKTFGQVDEYLRGVKTASMLATLGTRLHYISGIS